MVRPYSIFGFSISYGLIEKVIWDLKGGGAYRNVSNSGLISYGSKSVAF
jgi:hypothetical protein